MKDSYLFLHEKMAEDIGVSNVLPVIDDKTQNVFATNMLNFFALEFDASLSIYVLCSLFAGAFALNLNKSGFLPIGVLFPLI